MERVAPLDIWWSNPKQKREDVLRRLTLVLPAYAKGKLGFVKRKKEFAEIIDL